jgi:hypothetical protein
VNPLSTLPSTAEQARHALLLLGAPAPARLVAEVHAALFDGDLSVAAVLGLLRERAPGFAAGLTLGLAAVPGVIALAEWPVQRRLVTPAGRRAEELAMVVRVAEFVAARPGADRCAGRLLRALAHGVPHDLTGAFDLENAMALADAARAALTDARLTAAVEAEAPARSAASARTTAADPQHHLFGVPAVPHQRGRR